jgi:ketosteroid isomerase-like protein
MSAVSHTALIRETWAALEGGDLEALEAVLAPDARWRAVEDGPWNCDDRDAILEVMRGNLSRGLAGEVEEVLELGDRAVVAFRPAQQAPGAWPLEDGIRYVVVTMRAEHVVEMKGCAHREAALAYANGA